MAIDTLKCRVKKVFFLISEKWGLNQSSSDKGYLFIRLTSRFFLKNKKTKPDEIEDAKLFYLKVVFFTLVVKISFYFLNTCYNIIYYSSTVYSRSRSRIEQKIN